MKRSALFALAGLLLAAPALAFMLDVPLAQNASESDAIVRGTVVSRSSHFLETGERFIVTDVTLAVTESWKGTLAAGRQMTFRVNGGEVGELGMRQEHQAAFVDGEDVVLFLRVTPSARWAVSYDEQGKFSVHGDRVIGSRGDAGALQAFRSTVRQLSLVSPKRDH